MLRNAINIALRNLRRNRGYALLNIFGLGLGLACCLLIMLYVRYETGYDQFHEKGDQVYRMALERIYPDHSTHYAVIPHSYGPVAVKDFPEIESQTRIGNFGIDWVLRNGDKVLEEDEILVVDSTFFEVFGYEWISGDAKSALTGTESIVLTESFAKRIFGNADVVGKTVEIQQGPQFVPFTVTGIMGDLPHQTHMKFEALMPIHRVPFFDNENYLSFSAHTYLLTRPGTDAVALEAKLPQLVDNYAAGQVQRQLGISYKEYREAGNGYRYYLQPLTDIHLTSNIEAEHEPNGNETYIFLFTAVAIFILLIAIINFMNLATARASERAREVGVRKVLGSYRGQLITQFLVEATVLSAISFMVALILMRLGKSTFEQLSGQPLDLNELGNPGVWPFLLLLVILVGVLAGSYPAFMLSGFRPVEVLRGAFRNTTKGKRLRNGLVVFQFFISIGLMAATAIVYQQMQFVRTTDLGYSRDRIVRIDRVVGLGQKQDAFRTEVEKLAQVEQAGYANSMPGGFYFGTIFQQDESNEVVTMRGTSVDETFLQTLEVELVAGRFFSRDFNDTFSVVLNQSAVQELGLVDPVGKEVRYNNNGVMEDYRVVGVIEDYHYQSLHQEIGGLAHFYTGAPAAGGPGVLAVRLRAEQLQETLTSLEQTWQSFDPGQSFEFAFFDEELDELYLAEQASGRLFAAFAVLALVVACLGLFGLSAFMAQQRAKEISIRKVLGASVSQLVILQGRSITLLIWIAFVLAVPLIWYLMDDWLAEFAYHINLNPVIFLFAGLGATLIAWGTMSVQSLRTALRSPVHALRDE